jgi:hypothetical protein
MEPNGCDRARARRRNDTVDVWMGLELLIPGVQHAEEAELGTEM